MNFRMHECLKCEKKWEAPVTLSVHTTNLSGEPREYCPNGCRSSVMSSPVYEKGEHPILEFKAMIKAHTRKEIIEELKWFLEQVVLEADGGGSNVPGVDSTWEIKEWKK